MVIADHYYPDWECLVDLFLQTWVEKLLARLARTLEIRSESGVDEHLATTTPMIDSGFVELWSITISESCHRSAIHCRLLLPWLRLLCGFFFAIRGSNIASMACGLKLQPEILALEVRYLWLLGHGNPVYQ